MNINITNELLSAYAEGKVAADERNTIRNYLMRHPEELESVMIMMDEDYELEIESQNKGSLFNKHKLALNNEDSHPQLRYSAAAFVPHTQSSYSECTEAKTDKNFYKELNLLMKDLDL